MGFRTRRVGLVAAVVGLLITALPGGVAEAAWPGRDGPIVFRALTVGDEAEGQRALGLARVAVSSKGGARELTSDPSDRDPQVAPNGRLIAFTRGIEPGATGFPTSTAIFAMQLDGSGQRQLTAPPEGYADGEPAFAPAGDRLYFKRSRKVAEHGGDIYSVRLDGTGLKQLTRGPAEDSHPAASPRGRQLVFQRTGSGLPGRAETSLTHIFSMRPSGGPARDVMPRLKSFATDPDFSPSGRAIAFAIGSRGVSGLFTMRADGSSLRRLSGPGQGPSGYGEPSFAPDGRTVVAIEYGRSGPARLVRFDLDGDGSPRGVPGAHAGDMPAWGPTPGR